MTEVRLFGTCLAEEFYPSAVDAAARVLRDLKLKVRLRNGNSGVQYRSRDLGKWSVAGYQVELDNGPGKSAGHCRCHCAIGAAVRSVNA